MPEETKKGQFDGKVTLTFKGEDFNYDLTDPAQREKFVNMGNRGLLYDKEAQKELGDLRSREATLNTLFESAKTDDGARKQLKGVIEGYIGRELTPTEKEEVDTQVLDDPDENSKLSQVLSGLRTDMANLKDKNVKLEKQVSDSQLQSMEKQIRSELDTLESKYNGSDGNPKFVSDDVIEFANRNKLINYEHAYQLMNFDKLTEAGKKQALENAKDAQKKREKAFVETESSPTEIKKDEKFKNYQEIGKSVLDDLKGKGLSLTTDD